MNGLLRKDLLVLRGNGRIFGIMLLFYTAFSLFGSASMVFSMITLVVVMLPISSFSIDELARWDKFAAALPGGRRAVVKSKFQLLFLILAGGLALSALVGVLVQFFGRDQSASFPDLMITALVCTAAGLLMNCLLYPFLFKFGSQKARIYLAMGFGIIAAAGTVGFLLFRFSGVSLNRVRTASLAVLAAAAAAALAAAVVISYRVSCRIYDRKEF